MFFLGIDVSKAKLDCLLRVDGTTTHKTRAVPNTAAGVQTLLDWCIKHGAQPEQIHAVLEPTGQYHAQAATLLHDASMNVSLVNPAQARDFAGSKTDGIGSYVPAR